MLKSHFSKIGGWYNNDTYFNQYSPQSCAMAMHLSIDLISNLINNKYNVALSMIEVYENPSISGIVKLLIENSDFSIENYNFKSKYPSFLFLFLNNVNYFTIIRESVSFGF